jgi:hypothetical protein
MKSKKQKKKKSKRKKSKVLYSEKIKKPGITNTEIINSTLQRIKRLEEIHENRKKQHTGHDAIAYWIFIFIVVIGNFVMSLLIIFLIILIDHPFLYAVAIILGLTSGIMYERLINGMSHIFTHHHVFAKLVVVLTAIVGVFYIVSCTELFFNIWGVKSNIVNHIGISVSYYCAYLIPYFFVKIRNR